MCFYQEQNTLKDFNKKVFYLFVSKFIPVVDGTTDCDECSLLAVLPCKS